MYAHLLFTFMTEEAFHHRRKLNNKIQGGGLQNRQCVLENLIYEGVKLDVHEKFVTTCP